MSLNHSFEIQNILNSLPKDGLGEILNRLPEEIVTFGGPNDGLIEAFSFGMDYGVKYETADAFYTYMPGKYGDDEYNIIFVFKTEKLMEDLINEVLDNHPWDR